jgi:hypothetical protein
MREHVHHARCAQRVAVALHQHRRIARQRRRVARHVDDAQRAAIARQRLHYRDSALARRIDQHLVERAERFDGLGCDLEEIRRFEPAPAPTAR